MNFSKYVLSFIFILFLLNANSQELSQIDSLINVVKKQAEDTSKVDNLNAICEYFSRTNPDTAEYFGNLALSAAQKLEYKPGEALAYKTLGNIVYFQSNYTLAYERYNKSLEVYESMNDKKGIAILVRNLGSLYHQQGNYEKALGYFYRSLNARIEIGDKNGIASLYNAIGLVFSEQGGDFNDKALEYFEKALNMNKELENQMGIAQSYYRLSSIFTAKLKDAKSNKDSISFLNKSLDYSTKFLELSEKIGDPKLLADATISLGNIYLSIKKYDEAIKNFNKSVKLYESVNSQFGLANAYFSLGKYYLGTRNYSQAIIFYKKALDISEIKELNALPIGKNASLDISITYKQMGDTKNALFYFEKHIILKDSLVNEEKKNEIDKLEMGMEFQQQLKQKEMEQQEMNLKNEARLKQQQILTAFFIVAFILMIGLAFVMFRSYKNKQKANKALEEKNEEILLQKQHIMDSIVYAKRIQNAVLPPEEFINKNFHDHFVFFKPRDIVSGDFYWAAKKNNLSVIAAADSTGHGVPGAFMSLLGISFLNEIVNRERAEDLTASEVLNELRNHVKTSLRQTGKTNEAQDGMDIALCIFDNENRRLQYSGAYNPLLIVRNKEIIQYKADRMPVGIYFKEKGSFTNHRVDLEKDDQIYIFSDGFIDQFGGDEGEKFLTKRFKTLLIDHAHETMERQRFLLQKTYDEWVKKNTENEYEQLDDILVIGIKVD